MRTRQGSEYTAPSTSRMGTHENENNYAEAIEGLRDGMTELRTMLTQLLRNQGGNPPPPGNVGQPDLRQQDLGSDSDGDSHRTPPRDRRPERDFDITRAIKIDAPIYDGLGDPQVFLSWIMDIECYFQWHNLTNHQKVQVARMKLTGRAKTFWLNEERRLGTGQGIPRIGWQVMKNLLTDQ